MPPAIDNLLSNPYRILGLPTCAAQCEIESAARGLRIFADPAQIPPTPFDLPALGPLPRSRMDVESALMALADPASRLQARLRWYNSPPSAALPDNRAAPPATRLDSAIAALHVALRQDPRIDQPARWHDLLLRFQFIAADPRLPPWLAHAENDGDFEKPASPDEITDAVRRLPSAIIALLLARSLDALDHNDFSACQAFLTALTAPDLPTACDESTLAPLLLRVEDTLDSRCTAIDAELRSKLRYPGSGRWSPFYKPNYLATKAAVTSYDTTIRPLQTLLDFASVWKRFARTRFRLVPLLQLFALGWEWSTRYIKAEEMYQLALKYAPGSPFQSKIVADLARIKPFAAKARAVAQKRLRDQRSLAPPRGPNLAS